MSLIEQLGLATLHRFDPERAHHLSLLALRLGLVPKASPYVSDRLKTQIAGLHLPNPLGLAAGFDKNAVALSPLLACGFGFVEVGAATPRPQPGNPRPRLFRLGEDRAAINRFGFNNEGAARIAQRLDQPRREGIVGLNLGANKDSADRAGDFAEVLKSCASGVDFATINVSSPNTEKLRDLQGKAALESLIGRTLEARDALERPIPIFLKVAPDLSDAEVRDIAGIAHNSDLAAIVATNTTLERKGLQSQHAAETGGLSGAPLFEKSTRVLGRFALELGGSTPLIGVGGIATAEQAYTKIKAGASALQLYTALVFHGFSLVPQVLQGLDRLLAQDGHATLAEAVGTEKDLYA